MKKIGLMGGSFDPVHIGHTGVVSEALEQFDLDAFYFIPTGNNPWKGKAQASDQDRLNMLEIAIKEIDSDKYIGIETYEIKNSNEKNYTYQTIDYLIKKRNDVKYYYFMGSDQSSQFSLWKEPDKISKELQLVYFDRLGYSMDPTMADRYHFLKLNHQANGASSTAVRNGALTLLDDQVLDYIGEHGLYLETMIKDRMSEKRYQHTLSVAALARDIANANHLDGQKAYIAGTMHDVAKEMDNKQAYDIMNHYYHEYLDKPQAVWHQWLSSYVSEHEFHIKDKEILKAIEDHTTASTSISDIGMCLYVADKLDPLRGYDSSKDIELCKQDIHQGFKQSLISFYDFSKQKGRSIDPCFFDVYNKFVKGIE